MRGKKYFGDDDTQNYFIFQPIYKYFKKIVSSNKVVEWKYKELFDEAIKIPPASSNFFEPLLNYYGTNIRLKFSGNIFNQDKITYDHAKIVNIYIVYDIKKNYNASNYPTPENGLFGVVKLNKHPEIDK